ncbi:MAG: dynamin family protein [Anaerolineales bacterium]
MTFSTLLDERQNKIWLDEKEQIQRLLDILASFDTEPSDLEHLRQALEQLNELFLLVVVGEFNSGKSALINALLGEAFLEEGVTPTTDRIHIVKYGESGTPEFAGDDVRVLRFPAEVLREIHIVDTPGTNAVLRRHESIARDFVPRSDMVIFVTSADRPFTESERNFLDTIRKWGKKVVVVVNKIDILSSQAEIQEVKDFVRDQVRRLLEFEPDMFTLSARQGLRRDGLMDEEPGEDGGFGIFQDFLLDSLTRESVLRLKLHSPLGVALKISGDYEDKVQSRLEILREDTTTLKKVDLQLELYEKDTGEEFERHMARIDNELLEMQLRGEQFLDDHMRILNIREMIQASRMRRSFENIVVGDTPDKIEAHISEIIDWLVERELRQWRLMAEELGRRRETEALQDAAREAVSGFSYNRRQLIDSVGVQADEVINSFDRRAESKRLTDSIQESVAMVGLVEVGAISLGLVLNALLATAAADVTGILAAGIIGVLGLAIIPYRRGVAKNELRKKMGELQKQLNDALRESFEVELGRSVSRLTEALAPYRRFVINEEEGLQHSSTELGEIGARLLEIEAEIDRESAESVGDA